MHDRGMMINYQQASDSGYCFNRKLKGELLTVNDPRAAYSQMTESHGGVGSLFPHKTH